MADSPNRKQKRNETDQTDGMIVARVIDETAGLRLITGVKTVRIRSSQYVLLIMDDYSPTLGEVEGDVFLLTEDEEIAYRNIRGCYKQQNNVFTMIVEERYGDGSEG